MTAGNAFVDEMAIFGQRFVGLGDDVLFFFISRDVVDIFRNDARFFIDAAVRGFDETEFVDFTEAGQRGNQADVRAFRRFYRAHAAVVGMMDVADFEPCAFTGQTARAEGAQTAFVRDFCQRVGLVHELGQLAGTKEFFDSSDDRTDVDQDLRRNAFGILDGHAFADDAFHTGQADAELVLQEFADAAQAAVAQMVDVVNGAEAVHEVEEIADVGDDVFAGNRAVVIRKVAVVADDLVDRAVRFFNKGFDEAAAVTGRRTVGAFAMEDAAFADLFNFSRADFRMGIDDDFPCFRVDDRFVQGQAKEAAFPAELLASFVTANAGHIITARVEEEAFKEIAGTFNGRRFTGAEFLIDFNEGFVLIFRRIFFKRSLQAFIVEEEFEDVGVRRPAQRADEDRDRNLAVAVDTGIDDVVGVCFQFDPGPAVRDDRRIVQADAHRVDFAAIVDARRTDELADDNAFCPIDNEGTCIGNQWEITHEYFLVLDFTCFVVDKTDLDAERCGVCRIAFLTFTNVVLRFP